MPPNNQPSSPVQTPNLGVSPETPPSLNEWLETQFDQQYDDFTKALDQTGILTILPESLEMGIIGFDGVEYPLPNKDKIKQRMLENREVIEKKMSQGFTRLQLTPFALPLDQLIDLTKTRILKHHKAGKLFTAKKDPNDPKKKLIPLELDENEPLHFSGEYPKADQTDDLVYYPDQFTQEDHGGLTKTQILQQQKDQKDPFPGWEVKLLQPNLNIPAEDKGETIGNRPRLEANQKPKDYLKKIKTNPIYANESGLTPEDWLVFFTTHLKQTDQVIDDCAGNGKNCYLIASWFPRSGVVGCARWIRVTGGRT